jgi:sigma-B regulation protein RsbU (phosphoserine phosphatase)
MNKRYSRISIKLTLLFCGFAFLLCVAIGIFRHIEAYNAYTDIYSLKVQHIVRAMAGLVDGDAIRRYVDTDETDDYYEELLARFSDIKLEMDILYLYIFVPYEDHFIYILEAVTAEDDKRYTANFGDRFDYTSTEYEYLVPDIRAGVPSTAKVLAYNRAISDVAAVEAWAPVFANDGELVAMVEGDLSLDVVYDQLSRFLLNMIVMSSLIILAAVVLLAFCTHRMVTRPLTLITQSARSLVDAEHETVSYTSSVHTGDEFQLLDKALQSMSRDIGHYAKRIRDVAAAEERNATERGIVNEIQTTLLPGPIVTRDDFAVAGLVENGREISGVFYDFFLIDEARLGVVIAEALGRGISSAFYMTVAKTMIKSQLISDASVSAAMSAVNTRLYDSMINGLTFSLFAGTLDIHTGVLTYVSAAFPPPVLIRGSGESVAEHEQHAVPIGESRNVSFRQNELTLARGDKLALYTASLAEMRREDGTPYGAERLRRLFAARAERGADPQELIRSTRDEIVRRAPDNEFGGFGMLIAEFRRGSKILEEVTAPPRADKFTLVQNFLKRQLVDENGMSGAFYAVCVVAAEELFVLAARRSPGGEGITVRCGVYSGMTEIKLLFGGALENPLETLSPREKDAVAFVEKRVSALSYASDGKKNILKMTFNA